MLVRPSGVVRHLLVTEWLVEISKLPSKAFRFYTLYILRDILGSSRWNPSIVALVGILFSFSSLIKYRINCISGLLLLCYLLKRVGPSVLWLGLLLSTPGSSIRTGRICWFGRSQTRQFSGWN